MLLTDEQRAAVESDAPIVVVDAPPGTGKTALLVERIGRLLEAKGSNRLLVFTFTRAAAANLRDRVRERFPGYSLPTISTFHAWIIGHTGINDRIYPPEDVDAWKDLGERGTLRGLSYDDVAAQVVTPDDPGTLPALLADIDDLLIDEAQDMIPPVAAVVAAAHDLGKSVFLVGDARQAVYGFLGATPEVFEAYHAIGQVFRLTRTFRHTAAIAELLDLRSELPGGAAETWGVPRRGPERWAGVAQVIRDVQRQARNLAGPDATVAYLAGTWREVDPVYNRLCADGGTLPERSVARVTSPAVLLTTRLVRLALDPFDDDLALITIAQVWNTRRGDTEQGIVVARQARARALAERVPLAPGYLGFPAVQPGQTLAQYCAELAAWWTAEGGDPEQLHRFEDDRPLHDLPKGWYSHLGDAAPKAAPLVTTTIFQAKGAEYDAVVFYKAWTPEVNYVARSRARHILIQLRPEDQE